MKHALLSAGKHAEKLKIEGFVC